MTDSLPNILFIQADQLKPHTLSAYGGTAVTPNIDRLCGEGVMFENAYCNFPLCAPSRFSMLAGMLPSRVRAYDNGAEFAAATPTMAHYLRLAGYRATLSGKQHFVGPDMLHGFHERLVPELYPTDFDWAPSWDDVRMDSNNDARSITRSGICIRSVQMDHDETVLFRAISRLHDIAREQDRRPFFLLASFTHPHDPYFAPRRHWERYRHEDVPMPATPLLQEPERDLHSQRMLVHHGLLDGSITEDDVRTARHAYLANCSYLDEMVGRLLEALESTGLSRNTVIVVTSDHGDMLGERGLWFKKHFFEHASRVPLIVHAPWRFSAGRRSDNVSLVDLLPTLCELARIDLASRAPRPPDGASLVPLCDDSAAARNAPVFAEITSEGVPSPMFMVRHGPFKLMTGGGAPDALFDVLADPEERTDLAAVPDRGDTLAALHRLAADTWDTEALEAEIRASQRERRLVQAAHRHGPGPAWDALESDPVWASWCAVQRYTLSAGAIPARQVSFQPVALGTVVEATKQLKHSEKRVRRDSASMQAVTRSERRAGPENSECGSRSRQDREKAAATRGSERHEHPRGSAGVVATACMYKGGCATREAPVGGRMRCGPTAAS